MNVLLFAPSLLLLMVKVQITTAPWFVSSLHLSMLPTVTLTKLFVQSMSIKGVFFALFGAAVVQVHCSFFYFLFFPFFLKKALPIPLFPVCQTVFLAPCINISLAMPGSFFYLASNLLLLHIILQCQTEWCLLQFLYL